MRLLSHKKGNSSTGTNNPEQKNPGPPGWRLCEELLIPLFKNWLTFQPQRTGSWTTIKWLFDRHNHEAKTHHLLA